MQMLEQGLPSLVGTLQNPGFCQNLATAVSMAKEAGCESGFFVWFDAKGNVRVNQPILGEATFVPGSGISIDEDGCIEDQRHPKDTGFYVSRGGLVLAFVQIHSGTSAYSCFPSVSDIAFLQQNAHENQKLADWFHGLSAWPNPLMLIVGSGGKTSITQLPDDWAGYDLSEEPLLTFARTFPDFTRAWQEALLKTFRQSFGRLPKTKVIDDGYAAAVMMTGWPRWMLSAIRLQRFFQAVGISCLVTDLGGLTKADLSKFAVWVGY